MNTSLETQLLNVSFNCVGVREYLCDSIAYIYIYIYILVMLLKLNVKRNIQNWTPKNSYHVTLMPIFQGRGS